MARDASQVRQNIATNAVIRVTRVLDELRELRMLKQHKVALGTDGDFIDAEDFQNESDPRPGLAHLTSGVATGALDTADALLTHLESNGIGYFIEARAG